MTFMVTFSVDGDPVGKQRARHRRVGNFVRTYTPAKTVDYETRIREAGRLAMGTQEPLETPVTMFLYIRTGIPKSYSKKRREACLSGQEKPTKKPDSSNILKAVEDGLNGVVYVDDCQIINHHITKVYASESGIEVMVKECLE
jgi:Holliday junction resolvase RusA-like endonuclease